MEPDRLGKYEVRGTLGKGAMGTVYDGWDPIISRKVAIKTVRLPDAADIDAQEELARFKREAQAAGRLTHPNIVGVFDYGETDELAFIVMEFVDGRDAEGASSTRSERMPVAVIGRVMADLLAGLQYSHDRGVIHRDIKPANIMIVGGDGHGSGQAKIADFGIARIESSNMTQAGTIMGTPAYMSPEQFMGQTVDARTDIYSSGVLLFQLLTGERPFEGSMATIMHKALNTQPPKPSELSVTAPVASTPWWPARWRAGRRTVSPPPPPSPTPSGPRSTTRLPRWPPASATSTAKRPWSARPRAPSRAGRPPRPPPHPRSGRVHRCSRPSPPWRSRSPVAALGSPSPALPPHPARPKPAHPRISRASRASRRSLRKRPHPRRTRRKPPIPRRSWPSCRPRRRRPRPAPPERW